ncbi:MAG: cardiolipin synthase [Verrucomicrobia bacterium]|nr:cardiolipin synthase [Verrucomicrobiota bacterium]
MLPQFLVRLDAIWQFMLAVAEVIALVGGLSHVVLRQRNARAAGFWAVIIIFVPVLGALFYCVFGINRVRRSGKKYRGSGSWKSEVNRAVPHNPWEKNPELSELRHLATTIGRISRYEFALGNKIEVLRSGDEAMPAMIEVIRGAKRTLSLSSYIFEAKGIGGKFVDELAAAKDRGVEVRVMVDGAGTRYSWPSITSILRARGVNVAKFMPTRFIIRMLSMNLRNHRKILVADGTIGFTGGMNIRPGNMLKENPASPVRDMHFRVEGPVVRQLQRAFAEDWAFCTGEVLHGEEWYPDVQPAGETAAIGIPDGPDEDLEVMPKAIFAAINAARREIRVLTPYFLPDEQIQWALNLAALRGVDVKIITPRHNNIPPVRWASRTIYPELLARGVQLFENDGVFDHTKFMTVDGLWSLIGSTNWDPRSLRLNFEFNLACFDEALAGELNSDFQKQMEQSTEITNEALDAATFGERFRDGIARLFMPFL